MSSEPPGAACGHTNVEHEFYSSLNSGQIRVLKIVSAETLSFKLEVVSLEKCPKYGALSYVWGDSTFCKQITIQKKPFWITRNLFLALDQFRKGINAADLDPLKKYLWVDAICINQGDSEAAKVERSGQVQRMTQIYESAENVYVWLGIRRDEIRNSLGAARLATFEEAFVRVQLTDARKSSHKNWDRNTELSHIYRESGKAEGEKWSRPETLTKEAWLGIIDMWKSEWWTRAWAHQEGTVSGLNFFFTRRYQKLSPPKQVETNVFFIVGNERTTWTALTVALQVSDFLVAKEPSAVDFLRGTAANFVKVGMIRSLRAIKMKTASSGPLETINRHYLLHKNSLLADATPLSALETLNIFRMADCKDPRDKVFAAIGLLPALHSTLPVDYRRSTLEIYVDVIAKMLSASDASLDFLGFTCKTHDGKDILNKKRPDIEWERFPSWLPNWFLPMELTPLPKALHVQQTPAKRHVFADRYKMVNNNTASLIPSYSACGRFTIPNAVIGGNQLRSPGWEVDTVSDVMRFSWTADERTAAVVKWKTQLSKTTYLDGERFERDLRHVHCADVKYEPVPELRPVSRGYEIMNTVLHADKAILNEVQLSEQRSMRSTLTVMTRNRALCMTSKGRLGLVPYSSMAGDKIVALFGGQVLYVIRSLGAVEQRHEYIGEAYVVGLMDGEVVGMADRGEVSTQVFTLE